MNNIDINNMSIDELKSIINECIREREIDKELKLLSEANNDNKDEDTAAKMVTRFYEHAIKYRYNKEHQTQSWVNSIMQSVDIINDIFNKKKSLYNKFIEKYSNKMYNLFIEGRNDCFSYNRYITIQDAENIYNEFDTVDKIADINKVKNFCLEYAKNDTIRREVENKVK